MKRLLLSFGVLVVLAAWSGWEQTVDAQGQAVISGVISGPNGPLGNLTINILDSAGRTVGTVVTSPAGSYTVGNLATGTYTVQVVSSTGAVMATGVGTAATTAALVTVNVTLTASQLALAAIGAGGVFGLGLPATLVLGSATLAGGGLLLNKTLKDDPSPTQ